MKKHANIAIFVPHAGCPHDCSFCDQRVISGESDAPTTQKVRETLQGGLEKLGCKSDGAQIAFFGGSFTAIPSPYRLSLLEAAQPFIRQGGYSGIRISTRPDYIDESVLAELKYYRVQAIELGVQSMDEMVLLANCRGHTPDDVRKASRMIRACGFSLGHQMMTGLYKSTPEKEMYTAKELSVLNPETMRIYPTLVLNGTGLAGLYNEGLYIPPSLDESIDRCAALLAFFNEKHINVIRLGLHGGGADAENIAAGSCHPAFRELCEGRIFLDKMMDIIKHNRISPGKVGFAVNPRDISKATGQRKCNAVQLKILGYTIKLIPDMNQEYLNIKLM